MPNWSVMRLNRRCVVETIQRMLLCTPTVEASIAHTLYQENATAEKENLNRQLLELAKESGKVEFLNSKVEQLERENSEYKRMIENNKKIDDKQQSLLDQPEATPKPRKTQKPNNNEN